MPRILVAGGYGAFGQRLVQRLGRERDLEVIIAGRSLEQAQNCVAALSPGLPAKLSAARIDATRVERADLAKFAPAVAVNASGPFQEQNTSLAQACISSGCHYVDLADSRSYLPAIVALDARAKAAGVAVITGASTVPGLSSAAVAAHAGRFSRLTELEIGISPGNHFDPGLATTASVLSYAGKPINIRTARGLSQVYGWQGLGRHTFPVIGRRWMGNVEVPDLDLFPAAYPGLERLSVRAGTEVSLFHLSLWGLSWLSRIGLVRHPERLAPFLLKTRQRFSALGTDRGGMYVAMTGYDQEQKPLEIVLHTIALAGHGPFIPVVAASILAKSLARQTFPKTGAMACFELFTLSAFMEEVSDLEISVH